MRTSTVTMKIARTAKGHYHASQDGKVTLCGKQIGEHWIVDDERPGHGASCSKCQECISGRWY